MGGQLGARVLNVAQHGQDLGKGEVRRGADLGKDLRDKKGRMT